MPDLTLAASITRTELALADLALNASPYRIAGTNLDVGQAQRRRQVARSPYVHGGVEVASVKDMAQLVLAVKTTASTMTALVAAINDLITAFEQSSYTVTFTIEGEPLAYDCNAADFQGGLSTPHLVAGEVVTVFTCPRQPGTGLGTPP